MPRQGGWQLNLEKQAGTRFKKSWGVEATRRREGVLKESLVMGGLARGWEGVERASRAIRRPQKTPAVSSHALKGDSQ